MPIFRFYLNKTEGNEHSRVVDVEATDERAARAVAQFAADETEDSVVTLSWLQPEIDKRSVAAVAI